jgi:TatA/E family protein of Tat protein translocase
MGPIGMPEMVVIAVIALIIFGPRKLPELGKSLGKSIAEFKRASNELKHTLEEEIRTEELQEARKSAQIPPGHSNAAAASGIPPTTATPPAATPPAATPPPAATEPSEGEPTPRVDAGA